MPESSNRHFSFTFDEVKTLCAALSLYKRLEQGLVIKTFDTQAALLAAENASKANNLLERLTE